MIEWILLTVCLFLVAFSCGFIGILCGDFVLHCFRFVHMGNGVTVKLLYAVINVLEGFQ